MKILVICCFILLNLSCFGQFDVPNYDSLLVKFNSNAIKELNGLKEEYKQENKKFFLWYFIPHFGYDILTNRFVVSMNVTSIVDYFKTKKETDNKVISIDKKFELELKGREILLFNCYNRLLNEREQLKLLIEVYKNYKILYANKEKQYKNSEISPEDYLKEQTSFLEKKRSLYSYIDNINLTINELQVYTKSNLNLNIKYEVLEK